MMLMVIFGFRPLAPVVWISLIIIIIIILIFFKPGRKSRNLKHYRKTAKLE